MTRTSMMSETLAETHNDLRGMPARAPSPQRRLMAGLTAGAMALSMILGTVAPARADDNRDLVKALAALAVLGVIAHEIGKDRDIRPVEQPRDPQWHPDRHPPHPVPHHPAQQHRPRVPAACAIEIEGRDHRDVVVYADSCLRDAGIDRLPRSCGREVRFYGRNDRIYPEACLRDAGFRFGPGRRLDGGRRD